MNARVPIVVAVDDEPETLSCLRRLFRHEPYEFWTTSRPLEALDWVTERPVRLVMSDQRMASVSGSELLESVRRRSPDTIRMMLTAYPDRYALQQRMKLEIQQLVTKPWSDGGLRRTVERLLAGARGMNADLRGMIRAEPARPYAEILDALEARSTGLVVLLPQRGCVSDLVRGLVRSAISSDLPVAVRDRAGEDVVAAVDGPVPEGGKRHRFLLIGRDEMSTATVAGTLETMGHGGRIASSAMDAVHLLLRESFDLAIVDPATEGLPVVLEAATSVPVAFLADPGELSV